MNYYLDIYILPILYYLIKFIYVRYLDIDIIIYLFYLYKIFRYDSYY